MRILIVNKFLYPNGGSETYCFNLARCLENQGHQVQFFGMEHEKNIVRNEAGLYVSNVEFRKASADKWLYPFRIIYSLEAKRKIGLLIKAFRPDIIHLNNFNFQLTPSILYEIRRQDIPAVMTLHDFQLICPNHMLYQEHRKTICEACRDRKFIHCIRNRCIHNSRIKSILAAFEAFLFNKLGTYEKCIDCYIAPSLFLKDKFVAFGLPPDRIFALHNFIGEPRGSSQPARGDYVLYFGRISAQKGIETLIKAIRLLPDIPFVFAGSGELEHLLHDLENVRFIGFKGGDELKKWIAGALFTVYPSEWYENCPLSVQESQMFGTPVIGARIGGIPELVNDGREGLLFEPGNPVELADKIRQLYQDRATLRQYSFNSIKKSSDYTWEKYYQALMQIYAFAINKQKNKEEVVVWHKRENYTDLSS